MSSKRPYLCERCNRPLGTAMNGPDGRVATIAIEAAGAVADCTPATTWLYCFCGHSNIVHSAIAIVLEERPLDRAALGIGAEAA